MAIFLRLATRILSIASAGWHPALCAFEPGLRSLCHILIHVGIGFPNVLRIVGEIHHSHTACFRTVAVENGGSSRPVRLLLGFHVRWACIHIRSSWIMLFYWFVEELLFLSR